LADARTACTPTAPGSHAVCSPLPRALLRYTVMLNEILYAELEQTSRGIKGLSSAATAAEKFFMVAEKIIAAELLHFPFGIFASFVFSPVLYFCFAQLSLCLARILRRSLNMYFNPKNIVC
jgi:hypothetical protein